MGVDISAYKNLTRIDCKLDSNNDPADEKILEAVEDGDYIQPYKNPDFPGRADEIQDQNVYSYEDSANFFSASYGYYGKLRDTLAEIAGYALEEYKDSFGGVSPSHCMECWRGGTGPFSELINFSDCEGIIGRKVSKKLLNDFNDFQEKAEKLNNGHFMAFYNGMKSAFEMASDDGIVDFH